MHHPSCYKAWVLHKMNAKYSFLMCYRYIGFATSCHMSSPIIFIGCVILKCCSSLIKRHGVILFVLCRLNPALAPFSLFRIYLFSVSCFFFKFSFQPASAFYMRGAHLITIFANRLKSNFILCLYYGCELNTNVQQNW